MPRQPPPVATQDELNEFLKQQGYSEAPATPQSGGGYTQQDAPDADTSTGKGPPSYDDMRAAGLGPIFMISACRARHVHWYRFSPARRPTIRRPWLCR